MSDLSVIVRDLGRQQYEPIWHGMQRFTDTRTADTNDEIWFCEHNPVFTMGVNASSEHLLAPGDIPVVQIDRGGQVTYHGPGQLMIYPLLDLRRARLGVRDLVTALEQSVVDLASEFGTDAEADPAAPGVYVQGAKLASVGLRIRRGCSFHGMALNVFVDREPFSRINPCGFQNLEITDMRVVAGFDTLPKTWQKLLPHLLGHLHMDELHIVETDNEPQALNSTAH